MFFSGAILHVSDGRHVHPGELVVPLPMAMIDWIRISFAPLSFV